MEMSGTHYGTFLIAGGLLLSLFGVQIFIMSLVIGTCPNWTILYWKLLGIIIIMSGISATLSGLLFQNQDYLNSALFSLISILSIIPTYSINESFNDVASNNSMPYSLIFSVIVIAVLSQSYSLQKGLKLMTGKYKIMLSIVVLILIIISIMIWSISFEYRFWEGRNFVTMFPYRYTSICYFIISGYIAYWLLKRPKKTRIRKKKHSRVV